MKSDQYIYGFVRKDLAQVQRIIQFGHASFEVGVEQGHTGARLPSPPNVCLFQVADERELIAVVQALQKTQIKFHAFYESDYDAGYTALATEPISGEARLFFKDFTPYSDES